MNRAEPTVAPDETRCLCGRLLARLTDAGIELKCPRCRRVVVIGWSAVRDERSASSARE
jgi:phage FluMu protein Com